METTPAPNVPILDLAPHNAGFKHELLETFDHIIDSGGFILGPHVEAFEEKLAAYCGCSHALGLTSGTDALLLAMMALDIGPGDEVITTPFTWFSTASCIARLGAKPVFVDIHPRTYNIDTRLIEGAITDKTKAIMPVHLFGLPANMEGVMSIAQAHGLKVIEDAAQAIGASHNGQPIGSIGDVGCFSFYPTKNLSAFGDAGGVTTNDPDLAARMKSLRNHGIDPSGPTGYHFPEVGANFRMSAFQGAVLKAKISKADAYSQARRKNAEAYSAAFESLPVSTPFEPETRKHVYHQYTIRVRSNMRDAVLQHLNASHVGAKVFYAKPLHLQPCFEHLGYREKELPVSEQAAQEVLSLPVYPEMTEAQRRRVIEAVSEFFQAE